MTPLARRNTNTRPVKFMSSADALAEWQHRRDWDAEPTRNEAPAYPPKTESTERVTVRMPTLPEYGEDGCPATGVAGQHSDAFIAGDGSCQWCGARPSDAE